MSTRYGDGFGGDFSKIFLVLASLFLWQGALAATNPAATKYPLFSDQRGGFVDPYLQREVKNTVTANARQAQECYNHFVDSAKAASSEGTIHYDWQVSAAGKASQVRVVSAEFGDKALHDCLSKVIATWQFPPPGEDRYCEHRFQFKKK